ncbi:MAG: hypothetical protein WB760_14400 [Xanthobacteraceae bacterium]
MAIFARLFMVIIAYVLACIAAAIVLTISTLTPQWDQFVPQDMPAAAIWAVVGIGTAIIGGTALLPALLLIALTEGFAWRSIVLYGVLGGALALALTYGIDFAGYVRGPESMLAHAREVIAASGIAGGLVYWACAGRKAGSWKWQ